MELKTFIRALKTSPWLSPMLVLANLTLWLVDWLAILTTPHVPQPDKLLILRLDVLGDYLLFRGSLATIRKSDQFKHYHITYCGNQAVRAVAEVFDKALIDDYIWADIYALSTRPLYRFRFVRAMRRRGFSTVFCPTQSRVLVLDDFLSYATGAPQRIGAETDYVNQKRWEAWLGDRLYTRLLRTGTGLLFELERNRRLVESLLNQHVPLRSPYLDPTLSKPVAHPSPCIIISLGAGQDFKIWPASRFATVAAHLLETYPDQTIILTGTAAEQPLADAFRQAAPSTSRILDQTGKLALPELVYLLRQATLLIANETGTVHLAASTQTPAVVISQGKALLRWHPYPASLGLPIHFVYPPALEAQRAAFVAVAQQFNPESPLSIEDVTVAQVVEQADRLLALSRFPMG